MDLGREAVLALPATPAHAPLDPHYRGWFELCLNDEEVVTYRALSNIMDASPDIKATVMRARGFFAPAQVNPITCYELGPSEMVLNGEVTDRGCLVHARATFGDGSAVDSQSMRVNDLRALFAEACWRSTHGGSHRVTVPRPALLDRWSVSARELFVRHYPSAASFWNSVQEAA